MKAIKALVCTALALGLVACGGGGSSSGGGQLAGNYVGTVRYTLQGPAGSLPVSATAVLVVFGSGEVGFSTLQSGGGVTCSPTPRVFLHGNTFSYSFRYGCNIPGVGGCTVYDNGSGTITGNTATAMANGVFVCPRGNVSFVGSFRGTRQLAKAPGKSSVSTPGIGDAINNAIGH